MNHNEVEIHIHDLDSLKLSNVSNPVFEPTGYTNQHKND
jgi:hypothetical protein